MRANTKRGRKIFHVSNGTIEIYDFNENYSRSTLFRLEEMKKIPENEQVLYKEANRFLFQHREEIVYECDAYSLRIKKPKNMAEVDDNYFFVHKYIEGLYKDSSVHVRERENTDGEKLFYINPKDGTPGKKIQITEDLYLAYLLENERFDAPDLQTSDLSNHQELFTISDEPIAVCDMDSLRILLKSGLVKGNYDDKKRLLQGSTKIYEKLKKKQ